MIADDSFCRDVYFLKNEYPDIIGFTSDTKATGIIAWERLGHSLRQIYAILHSHWKLPLRDFDCESTGRRRTTELRNDYANMSCCLMRSLIEKCSIHASYVTIWTQEIESNRIADFVRREQYIRVRRTRSQKIVTLLLFDISCRAISMFPMNFVTSKRLTVYYNKSYTIGLIFNDLWKIFFTKPDNMCNVINR